MRLVFGKRSDAETARDLCLAELRDNWTVYLQTEWLPINRGAIDASDWTPSRHLTFSISFGDQLRDVQRAMLPFGALEVRLSMCSLYSLRSGSMDDH